MVNDVALIEYEGDVGKALERGLELIGGFQSLCSPVVIKPNICTISDTTGYACTNVEVVEGLIRLLLKENSEVSIEIVESDSGSKFADEAFQKFGYRRLEEKMRREGFDVSLVNITRSRMVPVNFSGIYFQNPELPEVAVKPSYVISVAVAKTHYLTSITGILKNQFGFLPRKGKYHYHSNINGVIVDLNRLIQPSLCVVDARVGLEGWNGPGTRRLNAFILGHKPVSVDATMARLMGLEPTNIRHVFEASKYDLGILNPTIQGQKLESIKVKFDSPI